MLALPREPAHHHSQSHYPISLAVVDGRKFRKGISDEREKCFNDFRLILQQQQRQDAGRMSGERGPRRPRRGTLSKKRTKF